MPWTQTPTLCLLLAAAVPPPAAAAAADVVPPGWHGVPVERRLDIDALRERCCVQYRVERGDTMARIAERECGDLDRLADFAAANEGLEPARLTIGQRLWVPPRGRAERLRFAYVNDSISPDGYAPVVAGQPVYARYGTFTFLVVDKEHRAAFEAEKTAENIERMQQAGQLTTFSGDSCSGLVRDGSAVTKIVEQITVTHDPDRGFGVASEVRLLDAAGRTVEDGRPAGSQVWLLLLSLTGAAVLLARRARRRAAGAADAAV
jgi:hypothetical protein